MNQYIFTKQSIVSSVLLFLKHCFLCSLLPGHPDGSKGTNCLRKTARPRKPWCISKRIRMRAPTASSPTRYSRYNNARWISTIENPMECLENVFLAICHRKNDFVARVAQRGQLSDHRAVTKMQINTENQTKNINITKSFVLWPITTKSTKNNLKIYK